MTGSFCQRCERPVEVTIGCAADEPIRNILACGCHETEAVGVLPHNALEEMDIPDRWDLWDPFESLYDSPTP